MIKVLSTKQLDDSELPAAISRNFEITSIEFIERIPVVWSEDVLHEHDYQSVAFTSDNAVKYFFENTNAAEWIKGKNVFSVSGKTNEELLKRDIHAVIIAENTTQLVEEVSRRKLIKSVLHVCGNIRLETLHKLLMEAEIKYYPLEVYHTKLKSNLPLNNEFDAILFYSPSGVDGFLSSNKMSAETICCCIGYNTKTRLLAKFPNAKILVSAFPSAQSMLERLATYFNIASN